jgi:hypothetical protein
MSCPASTGSVLQQLAMKLGRDEDMPGISPFLSENQIADHPQDRAWLRRQVQDVSMPTVAPTLDRQWQVGYAYRRSPGWSHKHGFFRSDAPSREKDLAMEKSLEGFPSNVRILEVDDFDERSFDELEPIIVRGAVARASKKWTATWLLERFGNDSCQVSLDSRPAIRGVYEKQVSLEEYLGSLAGSDSAEQPLDYLFHSQRDFEGALDLLEDLDVPTTILDLGSPSLYRFFVGPPSSGTLPHFHTYAINALARGRKRWAIYVCDDRRETNELLEESNNEYRSGSQARDWFAQACPELRSRPRVRLWEFAQEPGDLVYIPAWYIHAVVNLEPVAGFTVEFQPQYALRGPMGPRARRGARGPMGARDPMGGRRPIGAQRPNGR